MSDCFQTNVDFPSLNQKVGKTSLVEVNLGQIEKGHTKAKKRT